VTVRAAPEATGPQSAAARYLAPPAPSSALSVERRPNVARVYDCLLGGSYNFAVDREFAAVRGDHRV
jgi:hypothetical protein